MKQNFKVGDIVRILNIPGVILTQNIYRNELAIVITPKEVFDAYYTIQTIKDKDIFHVQDRDIVLQKDVAKLSDNQKVKVSDMIQI